MTNLVESDEQHSASGATVLAFPRGAVEFYAAVNEMLDAQERYEVAHEEGEWFVRTPAIDAWIAEHRP